MGEPGTKELLSLDELEAAGNFRTGRKHILSILVENKPGVLTRITGLFARRGFNIDTLAVGPTDNEQLSRITMTLDGAVHSIDQVTKQLHKLVNVLKIRDLEPEDTLARELALFKISADGNARAEVMQICEIFRAKIVDVSKRSLIAEITGTQDKIEAFERLVRPFGLVEMARTGEIAIARGPRRDLTAVGDDGPAPARLVGCGPVSVATKAPRWLGESGWRRLRDRAQSAVHAARRHGHAGTLISVSERLDGAVDPSPVVIGSRRPDEHWFCFEQPDRDGTALAALGCVHEVAPGQAASGALRWSIAAGASSSRWHSRIRRPARRARGSSPSEPLRSPPAAAASPTWRGFEAGSLIVPELSLARRAGETWLTVNVMPEADDTVEAVVAGVERRLAELRAEPLPLLDPAPTGHFVVHSPMPPSHYEEAVARAVQRIQAGELEKIVLAREVQVSAPTPHDPGAVFEVLRDRLSVLLRLRRRPGSRDLRRRQPRAARAP